VSWRDEEEFSIGKLNKTLNGETVADSMLVNRNRSIAKKKQKIIGFPTSLVGLQFIVKGSG
jgi:hypothetical protein